MTKLSNMHHFIVALTSITNYKKLEQTTYLRIDLENYFAAFKEQNFE